MMKYTHRITVAAWITFDVESDNREPTADEVDTVIGDYIEPHEVPEIADGAVVNIQSEAFTELPEDNERGNRMLLTVFHIEDTITNEEATK